MAVHTHVTWCR